MRRAAFTLIELLIVIAIIAILALIAVPNFLEAQVRAKVARTMADMRAMATAMESYYSDHGGYPLGGSVDWGTWRLTTPMAYMTSLPMDSFLSEQAIALYSYSPYYFYVSAPAHEGQWGATFQALSNDWAVNTLRIPPSRWGGQPTWHCPALYQIRSFGPNKIWEYSFPYNPTNGTISEGDIAYYGPGNTGKFGTE